jgi:hypothetical protein
MLDDAAFRTRLRDAAARLTALADELLQRGLAEHPGLDVTGLRAAIHQAGGVPPGFEPMLFPPAVQFEAA